MHAGDVHIDAKDRGAGGFLDAVNARKGLAYVTEISRCLERRLPRTAAQQTAVAELGRYALAADDIASVARAAEITITDILGPDDWHARVTWPGEPDLARNCIALFDEDIQRKAQEHLARAAGLRGALDNGEIEPHYQPIVDLETGRVVGVEALARWRLPSGKLVAPNSFIGLAEDIGLTEPLGQHILRTACRDALAWSQSSPEPFMLSVNVSPRQFASGDLASMVLTALTETGFDATCLLLEITESALMNEPSVQTTIGELRKHGIRFAIDDFGTGYSSLASLRQLPVDFLKIDGSFVSGITTNAQDRALITAAIDLARSFGLAIIAEGVETREQLRELTALNCDLAQGYLWGRPVEAEKVTDVMENIGKVTHFGLNHARHSRGLDRVAHGEVWTAIS